MASLAVMQTQAARFARRLGVDCPVRVQWAGACERVLGPDVDGHCHVQGALRGTICIQHAIPHLWVRGLVAHEVVHLLGLTHDSPAFHAALLQALGKDALRRRPIRPAPA